jgi:tetratricopeptide (TPR) repeat protein
LNNAHFQRGLMLYQQARFEDAERELGFALGQNPEDAWALALLGACRAQSNKYDEAVALGRRAIGLNPDSADIRHLVARIHFQRNDLDAVLETVNDALAIDPHSANCYSLRAAVHARRRHWKPALADIDTALELDPRNVEALNIRSLAQRGLGNTSGAEADLVEALQLTPEDARSHANLGWSYLENHNLEQAEKHFREALRLDPELEWARVGVLETTKAKVPIYRWILSYFLSMQRLTAGKQWAILIGLFVLAQVAGGLATSYPAIAPLVQPLLILYALFCVATWFAMPLSNAMLLFHPLGRMALSAAERVEAAVVAGLIAVTFTVGMAGAIADNFALLFSARCVGTVGLPLAFSFRFAHHRPRKILRMAAGLLCLIAAVMVYVIIFSSPDAMWPAWQLRIIRLLTQIFLFAPLAVLIGVNMLATRQWQE